MSSVFQNIECVQFQDYGQLKSEIRRFFAKEEVFTDSQIRLPLFAERINISPKVVSRIIKNEFNKGFNELLNKYRIRYAIEKIEEGYLDFYTLEALGEESGFSSRTTFFNAFKKEEGISPSEYWKNFQELPD